MTSRCAFVQRRPAGPADGGGRRTSALGKATSDIAARSTNRRPRSMLGALLQCRVLATRNGPMLNRAHIGASVARAVPATTGSEKRRGYRSLVDCRLIFSRRQIHLARRVHCCGVADTPTPSVPPTVARRAPKQPMFPFRLHLPAVMAGAITSALGVAAVSFAVAAVAPQRSGHAATELLGEVAARPISEVKIARWRACDGGTGPLTIAALVAGLSSAAVLRCANRNHPSATQVGRNSAS